jgi:hypothetical protein
MAMMAAAIGLNLAGAKMSADAANVAARNEQAQLNAAATQEDAAGQHAAEQARRKSDLMISRALAVGAASGAGTTGLDSILRGIAQEGETQAGYTTYESTEKAKGMRYRGQVGVAEAKARGKSTMMQAVASSAMTLAGAYGGGSGFLSKFIPTQSAAPIIEKSTAMVR